MTDIHALPTLGVALNTTELADHLALVRDAERDVELQDFLRAETLEGDWRSVVQRAKALLNGHGGRVGIHGPFFGFSLSSSDPDVAAVIGKRLDRALDVCAELSGTHMVIHSPISIWDHHHFPVQPGMLSRIKDMLVRNIGPAAERARDIGCTLVLENIEDCDPATRRTLIEEFPPEAVALSIDTGHANLMHFQFGAPPVDAYVYDAGPRLAHMHIQDTDGRADRHWLPGEGNIPWRAVFKALDTAVFSAGAQPRLMIEVKDKARLGVAVDHLAGLGLAR